MVNGAALALAGPALAAPSAAALHQKLICLDTQSQSGMTRVAQPNTSAAARWPVSRASRWRAREADSITSPLYQQS